MPRAALAPIWHIAPTCAGFPHTRKARHKHVPVETFRKTPHQPKINQARTLIHCYCEYLQGARKRTSPDGSEGRTSASVNNSGLFFSYCF